MGRGFDIAYVEGSKYYVYGVQYGISCIEVRCTMGRRGDMTLRGSDITWKGDLIYHG